MTSFKLIFLKNHSAISFYRILETTKEGVQWENGNKYDGVADKVVFEIPISEAQYHYGVEMGRLLMGETKTDGELMYEVLNHMFAGAIPDGEFTKESAEKLWKKYKLK